MTIENKQNQRLDRVEAALRAVYRENAATSGQASDPADAPLRVARIMARVRGAARVRPEGDARFLWRFVSAGAVAAAALLVVAFTDLSQEPGIAGTVNLEDVAVTVMNPTLPF